MTIIKGEEQRLKMDPWTVPTLRTGRLTLSTSLVMRTQGVNDLFVNPSQDRYIRLPELSLVVKANISLSGPNSLRGEVAPSPSSGVSMLQLNTENGELFALYPTNYPSILKDRVPGTLFVYIGSDRPWELLTTVGVPVGLAEPEAEWKKIVDKINEIWSVLVTAHKKVYSGNLLSYTVFAVPVHLHKEHKFRALERQILQEMGTYLDQVRCPPLL